MLATNSPRPLYDAVTVCVGLPAKLVPQSLSAKVTLPSNLRLAENEVGLS